MSDVLPSRERFPLRCRMFGHQWKPVMEYGMPSTLVGMQCWRCRTLWRAGLPPRDEFYPEEKRSVTSCVDIGHDWEPVCEVGAHRTWPHPTDAYCCRCGAERTAIEITPEHAEAIKRTAHGLRMAP